MTGTQRQTLRAVRDWHSYGYGYVHSKWTFVPIGAVLLAYTFATIVNDRRRENAYRTTATFSKDL